MNKKTDELFPRFIEYLPNPIGKNRKKIINIVFNNVNNASMMDINSVHLKFSQRGFK